MMFCKSCDAEITPGQTFCVNCGARTEDNTYTTGDTQPARSTDTPPFGTPVAPTMPAQSSTTFAPGPPPAASLSTGSPELPRPDAPPAYGAPAYPAAASVPTSTLAVVSLIFGILGVILVLPVIGSLVAVVTGHMARREIRAAGGNLQGDGMAVAGLVMGYAMLVIGLLFCGLIVIIGALTTLGQTAP